jgi:hypothetical protein
MACSGVYSVRVDPPNPPGIHELPFHQVQLRHPQRSSPHPLWSSMRQQRPFSNMWSELHWQPVPFQCALRMQHASPVQKCNAFSHVQASFRGGFQVPPSKPHPSKGYEEQFFPGSPVKNTLRRQVHQCLRCLWCREWHLYRTNRDSKMMAFCTGKLQRQLSQAACVKPKLKWRQGVYMDLRWPVVHIRAIMIHIFLTDSIWRRVLVVHDLSKYSCMRTN